MQKFGARAQFPVEKIYFPFICLVMALTFTSLIHVSLGIEYIAIVALLVVTNYKHLDQDVLFWVVTMGLVLFMLLMSGRYGERGFNAPIYHALKFVNLAAAHTFAFIIAGFTRKQKRALIAITVLALCISVVFSVVYTLTVNEYAIRHSDDYGIAQIIDFNQSYSVVFLLCFSLVLMLFSRKKLIRIISLLLVVLSILFLLVAMFTTALLMGILAIGLVLAISCWKKSKTSFLILLILVCILVYGVYLIADPLSDWLFEITSDMNWITRGRIQSVIDTILFTEHENPYTYDRRMELASYSIDTFKENPLFGVGYNGFGYGVIGSHQEWADMLGVFGICGTTVFALLMLLSIRKIYRQRLDTASFTAFTTSLILFIVLGFLNPCLNMPCLLMMFVIIPNLSVFL